MPRSTVRVISGTHPFRVEQREDGASGTAVADIRARRCVHGREGDQAQVEITLRKVKAGGKRWSYSSHSLILSPKLARELALAICPEFTQAVAALRRISSLHPADCILAEIIQAREALALLDA